MVPATRGEDSNVLTIRAVWARVTPENRTWTSSPVMVMLFIWVPVPMALSSRNSTSIRSTSACSSSVAA